MSVLINRYDLCKGRSYQAGVFQGLQTMFSEPWYKV